MGDDEEANNGGGYYNSPAVKQISSHISDDHDNYHGADHDVVDDQAEEVDMMIWEKQMMMLLTIMI